MRQLAIALAAMLISTAAMAMPTEQEMERVMPVIEELSRDASAALKTGKMTRGQFAEMMLGYLPDADTEAAKVVLIRQAFRQLMLAGSTEKAVEAYALLDTHVADVPGGTFGEWCSPFVATLAKADKANDLAILLEHAFGSGDADSAITLYKQTQPTLRRLAASKNGGARLAAVAGRFAGLERRKGEVRSLRAALQRSPDDITLREKLGLYLAAMGDWKEALTEFAQTAGSLAEIAVWENTRPGDSPLTAADVATFWWEKADASKDAEVAAALRGHAAGWYQVAIDGGELPGLKKTLAEKRIAEVAKTGEVAAVGGANADTGKSIIIPMGKGVEMELVPIPAGKFTMGWDGEDIEGIKKHGLFPHPVTITRPFWMGKFPVTFEQWGCLEKKPEMPPPAEAWFLAWGNNVPMTYFGTDDNVDRFLDQLNQKYKRFLPQGYVFRLPTMAEWEYACRANGDPEKDICAMYDTHERISREEFEKHFVTLEERREMANRKGLSIPDGKIAIWPVATGTRPPNPWGLCDMMGNYARELIMDRFPANTPMPWGNYGPWSKEAVDWAGMDVDPLFWDDGSQAVGCCIQTGLATAPNRPPQNRILIWRSLRSRKLREFSTGFHVVIGPDLVGEKKRKAGGRHSY